ncbi:hypothetical protein ACHAWF_009071 [Thalassiosira exigua]
MVVVHRSVDAGTPSANFEEANDWNVIPVHFHGFEGLDATRNVCASSPEFECFGHRWRAEIFPGGHLTSKAGKVAISLRNVSEKSIELDIRFTVKNSSGKEVACRIGTKQKFAPNDGGEVDNTSWKGFPNYAWRTDIIDALVAGTLVIEVQMKCKDKGPSSQPFFAENPFCGAMRGLILDEEFRDVVFLVEDGDKQIRNTRKRSGTSRVDFHAHRFVLKRCAPNLAELCGSEPGLVSVPITGVEPETFRLMLFYIYGGKLTEDDLKERSKDIVEAANKFGVVNLKLEAEAWFVKSTEISIENVLELLLYADSMNCALLKEAVMDFILANRSEVLEKVSFEDAPGSIASDILAASMRIHPDEEGNEINTMRVCSLRKKLHEKGLDIDGSRETLIARLRENA